MKAPVRWRKALERTEELQEIEAAGTVAPWTAYQHSWLSAGTTSEAKVVGVHALGADSLLEDPDLSVPDAMLIMAARNHLRGLLYLAETVLRLHQPFVDPDGEAFCEHCVSVGERTRLWPCDPASNALAAVEGGDGQ